MTPLRLVGRLAVALVLALPVATASGASPVLDSRAAAPIDVPTAAPTAAPTRHVVLAVGDSVPSGHACDCVPFPQTYGSLLGKAVGAPVTAELMSDATDSWACQPK